MQGILDFLTSDDARAVALRRHFVFKICPMLNPDGVIQGNYRCSNSGMDLNRQWSAPSREAHPPVAALKHLIRMYQTRDAHRVALFCDLHGHSRAKGVFLYGILSDADRYGLRARRSLAKDARESASAAREMTEKATKKPFDAAAVAAAKEAVAVAAAAALAAATQTGTRGTGARARPPRAGAGAGSSGPATRPPCSPRRPTACGEGRGGGRAPAPAPEPTADAPPDVAEAPAPAKRDPAKRPPRPKPAPSANFAPPANAAEARETAAPKKDDGAADAARAPAPAPGKPAAARPKLGRRASGADLEPPRKPPR
ncbi:hypothetical protein JL720_4586 [Aureococcus anophagefferens]|nr:hypothetical protein JL720_4586 [Aureococcus anophagefferens]